MQSVGAIIFRQRVFLAIERELGVADAISITSHERPEKGILGKVAGERIESQRDISKVPAFYRGFCTETIIPPYVITRTSMPCVLVSV